MRIRQDAVAIRTLVDTFASDAFVLERTRDNVGGSAPIFDRERFWHIVIGCLLTTQQKSTQGSAVSRFLAAKPFLLALSVCPTNAIEQYILHTLTDFRGIRRTLTIARQGKVNLEWLERGGWPKVEQVFNLLRKQRERLSVPADKGAEREAANFIDEQLIGFGPKQSRNLWQWLGLTRHEIPLDSRVAKWVNKNLSFRIEVKKLSDSTYYERCLDRLQAACVEASVLPCIFDAAAFNDENKLVPDQDRLLMDSREPEGTTSAGYLNKNGQVTVRDTGVPGTDYLQRVYQLACSKCGYVYGANGSDIHDRKCPKCQGGRPGLRFEQQLR